jgi:hypothetical protein
MFVGSGILGTKFENIGNWKFANGLENGNDGNAGIPKEPINTEGCGLKFIGV